jgi:hypothetical protein
MWLNPLIWVHWYCWTQQALWEAAWQPFPPSE